MNWRDSGKKHDTTKTEDMNAISENTKSLFFSFFLSGSRIESFLLMSFSSPTLAFTEYIEESWLYFQGHHQSQRLYISWYVSSVKKNLYFRIVFRYHDLLSLRTLKSMIHPNESLFSRYSLALRGFWREKNRLLTFKATNLPRRKETVEKVAALLRNWTLVSILEGPSLIHSITWTLMLIHRVLA